MLIHNARVVTPGSVWPNGWLLCRDGGIALMGAGDAPQFDGEEVIDADGLLLLPGMIDVHVHGSIGSEAMDGDPEGLRKIARFFAEHGVTSFLATTWTGSTERINGALEAIAEVTGPISGGATILGAHLEGPYLNAEHCGAQDSHHIRRADRNEALKFLEYGIIRLLALAPEFPENEWLIGECIRRGITVSAAHTSATYEDLRRAVRLGLTQSTHTYNAMHGLHHRELGALGAALTMPEIRCELIADNIHVHPAAQLLLWMAKGRDGVILITDAVRGAGLPEGTKYLQDGREVSVNGAIYLPDGTLSGSAITLDFGLANFMKATGQPLTAVWQATSLNAARAIGVAHQKGSIAPGLDADLILMDEHAQVLMTIVAGEVVYRKSYVKH
ncbi:MAG: N-acetylglucosamine-6-phosphate deacetylase [Anaerolineae bacterium]